MAPEGGRDATNHEGCGSYRYNEGGRLPSNDGEPMLSYYIHPRCRDEDNQQGESPERSGIHTYTLLPSRNTSLYMTSRASIHVHIEKPKLKHSNTIILKVIMQEWCERILLIMVHILIAHIFIYSSSWWSVCRSGSAEQSVPRLTSSLWCGRSLRRHYVSGKERKFGFAETYVQGTILSLGGVDMSISYLWVSHTRTYYLFDNLVFDSNTQYGLTKDQCPPSIWITYANCKRGYSPYGLIQDHVNTIGSKWELAQSLDIIAQKRTNTARPTTRLLVDGIENIVDEMDAEEDA